MTAPGDATATGQTKTELRPAIQAVGELHAGRSHFSSNAARVLAEQVLGISTKTAENHRASVLDKLDARNTTEVVRYAVRKGLLD